MGSKRLIDAELPECYQRKLDCFACRGWKCELLTEPYGVSEKPCPFYAKREDVEQKRKKK